MTFDMAQELELEGVTINAVHPASLMPTKMVVGRFQPIIRLDDGVRNLVTLAIDPELETTTAHISVQGDRRSPMIKPTIRDRKCVFATSAWH